MVSVAKLLGGLALIDQHYYQTGGDLNSAPNSQYDIVKYLGGSGPYIRHPGFGISTDIPDICKIEQVQLISRHGERYPTRHSGKIFKHIYKRLSKVTWKGDLEWLNNLEYFVEDDSNLSLETTPENSKGPYIGTTNMENHGESFRERYQSLYKDETLPLFTSNSKRVHQSSVAFAKGFLGSKFKQKSKINTINEHSKSGENTLTPRKSCKAFNHTSNEIVRDFDTTYLNRILNLLSEAKITKGDAFQLFEYCAFEINVKGNSKICDLFNIEEFKHFAYHKDLLRYYTNGPGNEWAIISGSVLADASLKLLNDESNENKIWLSFTHDTDIDNFVAFLGLLTPKDDLPIDKIVDDRIYIHAYISPQAARIYIEKLRCGDDYYVRYIVNDAVIPIENCDSGPGSSCRLNELNEMLQKKLDSINFSEQCEIPKSNSTFYWDYKTVNYDSKLKI